ncbi:MAG: VCBS repeat-containing protein [Pseudomonadota bacterium]
MKKIWGIFFCLSFLILLTSSGAMAGEKKLVAVLPFTVNSAENIDYVRQGIWDMLASRISVSDKIDVASKDAVMEALRKRGGQEPDLADVYGLGKILNMDYIVWGSITKIGNSFSVDGKLIDIAASKSSVGVFTQSQGMDDLIPKITDFAKRINAHILGTVPSEFNQAAAPVTPAVPAPPPATVQSSRESQIISGMKAGRKGTYTALINPDFITGTGPLDKKNFWMSDRRPTEFRGMDIGDVNGDGLNETVLIDANTIYIYQKKGDAFTLLQTIKGNPSDNYIALDVADINQSGIKQIFVTNHRTDTVDSFVLEYRGDKYVKIASGIHWFLRVINTSAGPPMLLGQAKGIEKPFDSEIYEILWSGGHYRQGKKQMIPRGLSVYGLTLDTLSGMGKDRVIALNQDDYLCIYEPTDKPLWQLQTLGGNDKLLWKSVENFGGSNLYVENLNEPIIEDYEKKTFINLRILTYDTNNDGTREIVIVKNISSAARLFKNIRLFTAAEVYNLSWDGLGLLENWRTRKISGYVADYQFKDIDNDGENEVVLALVLSTGPSLTGRSVVVAYKMRPQQTNEPVEQR